MKLSTSDTIKFLVLYHTVLKESGIKVMNFLVTEEAGWKWNCKNCEFQAILMKHLMSHNSFTEPWKQRERNLYKTPAFKHVISEGSCYDFCASILGFLAGSQFTMERQFCGMLPSFLNISP